MNTVAKGDIFENKSYQIITDAINNGELGILPAVAKVIRKPKYYSKDREKNIIFDLSIEIWLKNAKKHSILYLIECKSSSKKNVPVDDVEEFYIKIKQVSDTNVKGIMITDKSFQGGGFTFAKNKGIMLIEVDNDNHDIILHKTSRDTNFNIEIDPDSIIEKFLIKTLGIQSTKGLKKLSSYQIEKFANSLHCDYAGVAMPIDIKKFTQYITKTYDLQFDFNVSLETVNGKNILGVYSVKDNTIYIDQTNLNLNQLSFVLGHELGHFFLHKDLVINQAQYNDFADSEYNFREEKYLFKNEKNWIEWQANKFSIALFLPKDSFFNHFCTFRKEIGISRFAHIYLDNQSINQSDYIRTVDYLANLFDISKTSVKFRIEELELITYAENKSDISNNIRNLFQ
jgi:Zn-dependent peptidase ImmA (M78 family)